MAGRALDRPSNYKDRFARPVRSSAGLYGRQLARELIVAEALQERTSPFVIDVRLPDGEVPLLHEHRNEGPAIPKQLREIARQIATPDVLFGRGLKRFAKLRELGRIPFEV